jgi:hypothetical protein
MEYVSLLVGLGLGILWIISLSMGSAALWFTWLVFVAAAILIVASFVDMRRVRTHTHARPD